MAKFVEEVFVRRLAEMLQDEDCKVVWFLGAGASVSSGIPSASGLVSEWLPRLKHLETGDSADSSAWYEQRDTSYDASNLAASYARVMAELFPTPRQRQEEIERITSAHDPAIGYALLSSLAADELLGSRANVVMTTNFDDLVAEGMYLTTSKKPLVVGHDNLSDFIRRSNHRPLIVKLHGDALLRPLNTVDETVALGSKLASKIGPLLSDSALIILGYGGNDLSIASLIDSAAPDSFPLGIYWLTRRDPQGPVWQAISKRANVFVVESADFDDFFVQLREALDLELADGSRWRALFKNYSRSLQRSSDKAREAGQPERSDRAERTKKAVDALLMAQQAYALQMSDPDQAESRFEEAVTLDPSNGSIMGSYANFLTDIKHDHPKARRYYELSLNLAPDNPITLGNFAIFLLEVHNEEARARELFERSIAIDPESPEIIGGYANLLAEHAREHVRAEALYEKSLALAPDSPTVLGNFANFLTDVRSDHDRAQELYERAIALNPTLGITYSNFATFIYEVRDERHMAIENFLKSRALGFNDATATGTLVQLLLASELHVEHEHGLALLRELRVREGLSGSLRLELAFYSAAHDEAHSLAWGRWLRHRLDHGTRSKEWSFRPTLEWLARERPTVVKPFEAIADVISNKHSIEKVRGLDLWAEWSQPEPPAGHPKS